MTTKEEKAYLRGVRSAYLKLLRKCLSELGIEDPETNSAQWVIEREETVAYLRELCETYGADNDWPDDLHLRDVLEKHFERALDNLG